MRRTTKKSSFHNGSADMDPLAEMARIRVVHVLSQGDGSASLQGTVEELLEQSLEQDPTAWSEVTRNVMRGVVEGLSDRDDATQRIRAASETAVLAVAKRWGNIVSAGKATVTATREAAGKTGMDSTIAAQQASLGAMEGALQAGPIAYPALHRELTPIVEDFENVLTRERRTFYVERARNDFDVIMPDYYGQSFEDIPSEEGIVVLQPEMDSREEADAAAMVRQALMEEFDFEESSMPVMQAPAVEAVAAPIEAGPAAEQIAAKSIEPPTPAQKMIKEATKPVKPSLWQSVKNFFGGLFSKK